MIFTMFVTDETGKTWEEKVNRDVADAHQEGLAIIANFNATLRPGERPRTLIRVEVEHNGQTNHAHLWEKTSLVTEYHKGNLCDRYQCARCGITGRMFQLGGPVARDKAYTAEKYADCLHRLKIKQTIDIKPSKVIDAIFTKQIESK